jgi:hypothetical protein
LGKVAAKERSDRGAVTAEYAIGTVAVLSFGTLLVEVFRSEWARLLIANMLRFFVDMIGRLAGW